MTLLTAFVGWFTVSPCVDLDAPSVGALVSRKRVFKPVWGAPWQAASAPLPAEQHTIVRAHRLTGYLRQRTVEREKDRAPARTFRLFLSLPFWTFCLEAQANMRRDHSFRKGGRGDLPFFPSLSFSEVW